MILYPLFVFSLVASATIANKIIVSYLPPFLFVGLRMGISGVILLLTCANGLNRSDFFKKNILALHVIALFTTFLPSLLRAYAQMKLASSRVAFWGTFEPFITALYMRILFKNELTVWQIFGCIIGFSAGAFFFIMNDVASLNLSTLWYASSSLIKSEQCT